MYLSEHWSPKFQSGKTTGLPMAGLVQGSGKAREVKGAPYEQLWALNAHHCYSGWGFIILVFPFFPRDPWQDLINQEIRAAFAEVHQCSAGPSSSEKAMAGP